MPTDTSSITLYAAVIGGAAAAIFSGGFAIWNNWLSRRSEERKHMRELAVKVAADNWKFYYEKNDRVHIDMESLNLFIMNAMTIVSFVDGKFSKPDQIRAHLRKGFSDADIVTEAYNERKKQQRTPKS